MIAKELYKYLDDCFIKPGISDDWFSYMPELEPFFCDSFIETSMGVACDFTETIQHVYTAVFPSEKILRKVLSDNEEAMLFVHHASNWDLKKDPKAFGFHTMDATLLEMMREKQISIYCLHAPLDNYSEYSTSKTLADTLDIEIIRPFANFSGAACGIIGKTNCKTVYELQKKYANVVGHETKLYPYGDSKILDSTVAVCAGGGMQTFVIQELIENNIKNLITGLTLKNDWSTAAHELAATNRINIFGGTHYSSEKFACIAMCKFFEQSGLSTEFIEDEPCFVDM
jgi:putative NIF3 family GTP cyclohydrolase 1 type 2